MIIRLSLLLALLASTLCAAKPFPGYEIRVSSETAPAGGVAQIKLTLTDPEPILTGSTGLEFDSSMVESILGIAVHSSAGDAVGTATYLNGRLSIRLLSPLASLGSSFEYPFLTIAVAIRPGTPAGKTSTISLDLADTRFLNRFGQDTPVLMKPGTLTVGGTVSIDNVLPGGGWIAAGQPVTILGRGFSPSAKVRMEGHSAAVVRIVSANAIEITSPTAYLLDGADIRLRLFEEQQQYYAYLRPAVMPDASAFAAVVPLFSWHAPRLALLSYAPAAGLRGIALQNPHTNPISVALSAPLAWNASPVTIALPAGSRVTKELTALFPGATPAQLSAVRVSCERGVSALGLQRISTAAPVTALAAFVLQAGPF